MPGLGRKVFTAGDVLTASDVQNYMMDQSVMYFAGTAARSSAIATPTTGMTSYIGVTGTATIPQIEVYNGSAWQTPYALTQVANVSFTSATSVSIDNVFSATYSNYIIETRYTQNTLFGSHFMKMRAGGVDAAGNWRGGGAVNYATIATVNSYRMNGGADYTMGSGQPAADLIAASFTLFNPFVVASTIAFGTGLGNDTTASYSWNLNAYHDAATAYDGIKFTTSAGSITGNIRIYGLRNS